MKKQKYILIAVLAMLGSLVQSCSSDDDSGAPASDTYIRFTIDGTDYDFGNIITAESLSITFNGNNGETIQDVGDTRISIYLPLDIVVGNHNIEGGAFGGDYKVSFTSEPMGFDFDFAHDGSINVTSVTEDYVEGTFTATIMSESEETITLVDGEFKAMPIE
ncbi:hypothetical protein K1F50_06895 [Muricauda oceani]|uniref:Lipocalin-like domain-containing protein n=1 Tax=Flagellimonas oceani TaxID=2698672 RepID=A0A6G7J6W7_9FLAO|nr:hypothetical protein [Allomuricauda oceani]MBW8242524.1 hypothetical protein [Allomuricauda oceani]QII46284.1 hypothetical protein GVT53_16880 [Allomuricauda oceani]